MGQGTESCGGYDLEYDEYEDGLQDAIWTTQDGLRLHVSTMTVKHLRNTLRLVQRRADASNFTCERDKWEDWANIIESELFRRPNEEKIKPKLPKVVKPARGTKVRMKCWCGQEYDAREADLKRGWGYSCSKSHAAIRRDFGKPKATRLNAL